MRGRGAGTAADNTEPLQRLGLVGRHNVTDSGAPDTLQTVAVNVLCQPGAGGVGVAGCGVARVAVDAGPLLDGLVVACDVQGGVGVAVEDLHLGVLSCVAGVHVLDDLRPLGGRLVDLTAGALAVP